MVSLYKFLLATVQRLRDLPPLIFRLLLAYGFYEPAINKVQHFEDTVGWFRDTLHIPYPELNTYMSVGTECTGIVLLTLGLATRIISVPMIVVMLVAISTVHWKNGFACGNSGFEVPFYYICMLFSLIVGGAGRISL